MKKIKMSLIAAAVAMSSMFVGQQSHAYALVSIIGHGYVVSATNSDGADTILCVLFFPFCVMQEKTAGNASLQDLKDNGYSDAQIANIMVGQQAVTNFLSVNGLKVEQQGALSASDLANQFQMAPGVTPEYLEFVKANY